jgi:hypothetical protein
MRSHHIYMCKKSRHAANMKAGRVVQAHTYIYMYVVHSSIKYMHAYMQYIHIRCVVGMYILLHPVLTALIGM